MSNEEQIIPTHRQHERNNVRVSSSRQQASFLEIKK